MKNGGNKRKEKRKEKKKQKGIEKKKIPPKSTVLILFFILSPAYSRRWWKMVDGRWQKAGKVKLKHAKGRGLFGIGGGREGGEKRVVAWRMFGNGNRERTRAYHAGRRLPRERSGGGGARVFFCTASSFVPSALHDPASVCDFVADAATATPRETRNEKNEKTIAYSRHWAQRSAAQHSAAQRNNRERMDVRMMLLLLVSGEW